MEQITPKKLKEAVDYWNQLLPIEERLKKLGTQVHITPSIISLDDLKQLLLISEKEFNEVLQLFWRELKEKAGKKEKISYWKFVYAEVYEETILRAYITSFLITYGYADLEINPLEEEIFLIPVQNPKTPIGKTQAVSVPISIDYDSWKKFMEKKS
jgi:hypothetical protein